MSGQPGEAYQQVLEGGLSAQDCVPVGVDDLLYCDTIAENTNTGGEKPDDENTVISSVRSATLSLGEVREIVEPGDEVVELGDEDVVFDVGPDTIRCSAPDFETDSTPVVVRPDSVVPGSVTAIDLANPLLEDD